MITPLLLQYTSNEKLDIAITRHMNRYIVKYIDHIFERAEDIYKHEYEIENDLADYFPIDFKGSKIQHLYMLRKMLISNHYYVFGTIDQCILTSILNEMCEHSEENDLPKYNLETAEQLSKNKIPEKNACEYYHYNILNSNIRDLVKKEYLALAEKEENNKEDIENLFLYFMEMIEYTNNYKDIFFEDEDSLLLREIPLKQYQSIVEGENPLNLYYTETQFVQ